VEKEEGGEEEGEGKEGDTPRPSGGGRGQATGRDGVERGAGPGGKEERRGATWWRREGEGRRARTACPPTLPTNRPTTLTLAVLLLLLLLLPLLPPTTLKDLVLVALPPLLLLLLFLPMCTIRTSFLPIPTTLLPTHPPTPPPLTCPSIFWKAFLLCPCT